jgi:hypothetical protein
VLFERGSSSRPFWTPGASRSIVQCTGEAAIAWEIVDNLVIVDNHCQPTLEGP